jgi:hypothetical protein
MDITTQPQQNNYLTAEGKTGGVVTKFKRRSFWRGNFQIKRTTVTGRKIDEIANAYINTRELINRQPDGTREKFKHILRRLKGRAKAQIIKDGVLNDDHLDLFCFRESDLSKDMVFRNLMIEFVIDGSTSGTFFKNAMRMYAKTGHLVDFSFANALIAKSNELLESDRHAPIEELPEEKYARHQSLIELSDLINDEINLRNKEKAQRANLCYFLLYDEILALKPEYIERCKTATEYSAPTQEDYVIAFKEDDNRLIEKIKNLSSTNLIELIRIYCHANNEFFKKEINKQRKTRKMINNKKYYKGKRSFTPEETKGFVKIYKDAGLNHKQIAHEIGCGLRTVERYSK